MATSNSNDNVTPIDNHRSELRPARSDLIRESIPGAFLSAIEYKAIRLSALLGVLHCIQMTLEGCAGNDRDSADPDITRSSDALDLVISEIRAVREGLDSFALSREAAAGEIRMTS